MKTKQLREYMAEKIRGNDMSIGQRYVDAYDPRQGERNEATELSVGSSEQPTPFWIVARLDGKCAAKVRHETWQEAAAEARRLATMMRGVSFYVLRVYDAFKAPLEIEVSRTVWGNASRYSR